MWLSGLISGLMTPPQRKMGGCEGGCLADKEKERRGDRGGGRLKGEAEEKRK